MLGFGPFSSAPISALRGNSYAVALSETITLTTSAVGGNLIDTRMAWGVGGWGSGWWGSGPSLYDTLTLTDRYVQPNLVSISESITLSTSIINTATISKSLLESLTFTALATTNIQIPKLVGDTIILTESVSSKTKYSLAVTEPITLNTSIGIRGTFNVPISEPITLTVSTSSTARKNVYLSDTLTLTATATSRPLWEEISTVQSPDWTIIPTYKV